MLEINVKAKRIEPYSKYDWISLQEEFKKMEMYEMVAYCKQKQAEAEAKVELFKNKYEFYFQKYV